MMGEVLTPRAHMYCPFMGDECTCVGCRFFDADFNKCTNIEALLEDMKASLNELDTEWFESVAQYAGKEIATMLVSAMRK